MSRSGRGLRRPLREAPVRGPRERKEPSHAVAAKEERVKYLLLICPDRSIDVSPEEADPGPWVAETVRRGVDIIGSRVRPAQDATSVRVRDGELSVTDGPFAEAKEQMAGFDVIECADLDEAIEVASKHPVARFGTVEVRPFWPFGED